MEALDAVLAPGMPGFEDHFGVAVREEAITLGFQFAPQFRIVVDAAVEGDGKAEFGVHHGLAGLLRQVDDREPPVPERRVTVNDEPGAVRPPRRDCIHHLRLDERRGLAPVETHFTTNPTHGSYQSFPELE